MRYLFVREEDATQATQQLAAENLNTTQQNPSSEVCVCVCARVCECVCARACVRVCVL